MRAFVSSYKQTIGLDFFIRRLTLPNDVNVAIQLWDIGGQTIGGKMVGNYIFGAQAVLLVYDISNHQSFQNLEDWYAVVKKTFAGAPMPYIGLVANKADLTHLRAVKPERHNEFADANEMYSYFMSAKTGDNVISTFYRIAADLAGVVLKKPDVEVIGKVVKAEIVNHPNKVRATFLPPYSRHEHNMLWLVIIVDHGANCKHCFTVLLEVALDMQHIFSLFRAASLAASV